MELILGDLAAPDALRRDAGLLGDDACRQLFLRHFEREEADNAAVEHAQRSIRLVVSLVILRHLIGDVGGKRSLAHRRAAGEDDEVGGLKAPHLLIEIAQAR